MAETLMAVCWSFISMLIKAIVMKAIAEQARDVIYADNAGTPNLLSCAEACKEGIELTGKVLQECPESLFDCSFTSQHS